MAVPTIIHKKFVITIFALANQKYYSEYEDL